jgi:beta-glucosidase
MQKIIFPKDFVWGTATAAYQIEGGFDRDGKGLSIWDDFTHQKGKIKNGDNGDITCDHYNRYKEDVSLMKKLGYGSYRFSISWPRILPDGKGAINQKGLDFYDKLVDELLKKNINPFVTLYHWDLPLALEKEGGWLNRKTSERFGDYTEIVVKKLGDRVKNWITLNEPWVIFVCGYLLKVFPPGVFKPFSAFKVAHNLLLAHGISLARIKSLYPNSSVGITNALTPVYNHRLTKEPESTLRADAIINRLWLDPIYKGKYPDNIASFVESQNKGNILPEDMKLISGKTDFLGVNNYSRTIVKYFPFPIFNFRPVNPSYKGAEFTSMGWEIYPQGLLELMRMIRKDYGNPPVHITENGVAFIESPADNGIVSDKNRISFLQDYLSYLHKAILEGSDIRGYFVWSFLDNFEWAEGFAKTFGLVHIDRKTLKRTPKLSANWYSKVCKENGFEYREIK